MKKFIKIEKLGPERSGISKKDGKPWVMTDVVVTWDETSTNGESYEQAMVVTLRGKLNRTLIEAMMQQDRGFELTYFMGAEEYEGRFYNRISGYIPKEYCL